jgi:orotate phosphoribosyltransferase
MTAYETKLRPIFRQFIHDDPKLVPIGRDGRIRVRFFLDLLSAAHYPQHLQTLTEVVVDCLKPHLQSPTGGIAGPKRGNTLLIRSVATALNQPCAFVRHSILFGRWHEGSFSGNRVVLIDDIASDGELLCDAVSSLATAGVAVDHVFAIVDRKEGDTVSRMKKAKTPYSYLVQLDDAALQALSNSSTA